MIDPIQLSQERLAQSRNVQIQKVVDRQAAADNQQEFAGIHIGFDCKTGQTLSQLPSGGIMRSRDISNGIAQPGSPSSIVIPRGGEAISDRMPR